MTGDSLWDPPLIFESLSAVPDGSASHFLCDYDASRDEKRPARKEVTKVMREVYRKDFDPDSGDYYYTNVRTNEVRWDNPAKH